MGIQIGRNATLTIFTRPTTSDVDAFLSAVAAAPDDYAPRGVFADFLDERLDERAAAVRQVSAVDVLSLFHPPVEKQFGDLVQLDPLSTRWRTFNFRGTVALYSIARPIVRVRPAPNRTLRTNGSFRAYVDGEEGVAFSLRFRNPESEPHRHSAIVEMQVPPRSVYTYGVPFILSRNGFAIWAARWAFQSVPLEMTLSFDIPLTEETY